MAAPPRSRVDILSRKGASPHDACAACLSCQASFAGSGTVPLRERLPRWVDLSADLSVDHELQQVPVGISHINA